LSLAYSPKKPYYSFHRKVFLREIDGKINKRIYELRKTLGLTQAEFGERLSISQAHMGNIEHNKRAVNDRFIALVSAAYGVNADWLRNGNGAMFPKAHDHKLERVIRNFKKLDDLLQDYVLKQLDLLLEYKEQQEEKQKTGKSC
jgi:transcriptional regulator with XRE-family HTH domain